MILIGFLLTACSGTQTTQTWSDQNFHGKVENIYIIGIAKKKENQKIFEDIFKKELSKAGITAVASYNDFPEEPGAPSREAIIEKMKIHKCDAVLLTRVAGERTTASFSGGGGASGGVGRIAGPAAYRYSNDLERNVNYRNWGNYYYYGQSSYVVPPSESVNIVVLTVESVMYDLQTEDMIWSAQLETYLESNFEKMVQLFAEEVIKDLKGKSLI